MTSHREPHAVCSECIEHCTLARYVQTKQTISLVEANMILSLAEAVWKKTTGQMPGSGVFEGKKETTRIVGVARWTTH
jgi:hypothetical protein